MTDEASGRDVVVSWAADRQRFAGVVNDLPFVKPIRRLAMFVLASSLFLVLVDVWVDDLTIGRVRFTDSNGRWTWSALLAMNLFATGMYILLRRSVIRSVRPGSRTWRFSDRGIRIESESSGGDTGGVRSFVATDYPWPQLARWYCIKEHLIVEIRRPNGKSPHLAAAAPLTAFSESEWAAAKERLVHHLGAAGAVQQ